MGKFEHEVAQCSWGEIARHLAYLKIKDEAAKAASKRARAKSGKGRMNRPGARIL